MKLSLIVAMDKNRLIGQNNQLPWHLPADLAYFKEKTMAKSIVMGRKTYESIGRALPGRNNIVLSRDKSLKIEGVTVVQNIAQAKDNALLWGNHSDELMVIGGSSLYQAVINEVDYLYITYVEGVFSGDTWFPEIVEKQWHEVCSEAHLADKKNHYNYRFVTLEKKG
jgi:dihydrofolate reductase